MDACMYICMYNVYSCLCLESTTQVSGVVCIVQTSMYLEMFAVSKQCTPHFIQ